MPQGGPARLPNRFSDDLTSTMTQNEEPNFFARCGAGKRLLSGGRGAIGSRDWTRDFGQPRPSVFARERKHQDRERRRAAPHRRGTNDLEMGECDRHPRDVDGGRRVPLRKAPDRSSNSATIVSV